MVKSKNCALLAEFLVRAKDTIKSNAVVRVSRYCFSLRARHAQITDVPSKMGDYRLLIRKLPKYAAKCEFIEARICLRGTVYGRRWLGNWDWRMIRTAWQLLTLGVQGVERYGRLAPEWHCTISCAINNEKLGLSD